ncbi:MULTISPECIES: dihydrofolate reductase family protein [Actinoalloteichus]|uniref:Dihydrofolate reductase n=1 Tax=Actinoalloteichus fjordicus TaxID=1612552 RepID=A0AAC9LC97_9PSEU|nr:MULTISPECIES: dihydrofolate reductase family protein [Actinoalloteichus]APU15148.1 dihydrofolate reductase [Actinoalloteichus fjordicus]APU21216.1 dihydrofolate reductase [Actinoalloteichus sp. GBA129-24]
MRDVVYSLSVSLDGFMESADGDISWSLPDAELHEFHNEQARGVDTSLYGRRLYQDMAGYWPSVVDDPTASSQEADFARIWLATPKVVFSRTLEKVEHNSTLVRDDLAGEVARLKALPGGDMDLGGAGIAASFLREDLIDEFRLFVHPVILGGGTPYFPTLPAPLSLQLADTRVFGSGVVFLRYRRSARD